MNLLTQAGALVFGLVVGYITYRTLVRTTEATTISDLSAVVSAIGGGAVVKLYEPSSTSFAFYAFGLLLGMVVFFGLFTALNGKAETAKVMGGESIRRGAQPRGSDLPPVAGPRG
jgi:bacteriorhodopsin